MAGIKKKHANSSNVLVLLLKCSFSRVYHAKEVFVVPFISLFMYLTLTLL